MNIRLIADFEKKELIDKKVKVVSLISTLLPKLTKFLVNKWD